MIRCPRICTVLFCLLAYPLICAAADAPALSLTKDGIAIDSAAVGKLTLSYPKLDDAHKQTGVEISGTTATVSYAGDVKFTVQLKGQSILFTPSDPNLPGVKNIRTEMQIPRAIASKTTWAFNDNKPAAFPKDKPAKPHLYQGQGARLTLRNADSKGIAIFTPISFSYNELTDNREWNWDICSWKAHTPVNHDWPVYQYKVTDADAPVEKEKPAAESKPDKPAPAAPAATSFSVAPDRQHIRLTLGPAQTLELSYPALGLKGDKKINPNDITVSAADHTVQLTYPNGAAATIRQTGRTLKLAFRNVPDDVQGFRMSMNIPFNFTQGGKYAIGSGELTAFPPEKPAKPMLYQGNADSLTLVHPQGGTVRLAIPQYSFQQLQDNREWNWKIFYWFFSTPIPHDGVDRTFTVQFSPLNDSDAAATTAQILVDKFGQNAKVEYPGKVHSIDELKQDVQDEQAYYASFNPPQLDSCGGLPGSKEKLGLTQTGFFHVQKTAGADGRWVMVDPDGNAFFQLGLCCFSPAAYTYTEGRESIYEWIPPTTGEFETARPDGYWHNNSVSYHLANMIRKYGAPMDAERFESMMIDRVRRFGFNSAGAFSGSVRKVHLEKSFPYVSNIPVSQWGKRPIRYIPGVRETWDPFNTTNIKNFEANCSESVAANKNNPMLIGYFLVNEPIYQDIPRVVPTLKGEWACKRRLVQMLQDKYHSIDAFNAAWKMQAASFDQLNDQGLPVTTQQAADDMQQYTGLFLETYFQLVHDTMKKYDPNHMLIGNRFQTGTANNRQLCEIAGKYLDVFSLNYYTYGLDRAFLDRLHQWTGDVPMMFTEFYWDSPSDSGLPGGVKDIGSQTERGLAYRHYVEHAAKIPYVVGVQWFTLVDASLTGQWFSKYTGENPNSGLFSVADRPWKPMIEQMAKTNDRIYDVYLGDVQPFVFNDPRFTDSGKLQQTVVVPRVAQPLVIDGKSDGWPGIPATQITAKRIVQGNPGNLEAAYKLAWDDKNLYVLVDVRDSTPMMNTQTGSYLWQGDGVELFIGHEKLDEAGPLLFTDRQILLGAGNDKQVYFANQRTQPTCQLAMVRGTDGYTLEAAIPFESLGFKPAVGQTIRFDMAIDDSADGSRRDRQLMWNGIARNSGDRSAWGTARLAQQ